MANHSPNNNDWTTSWLAVIMMLCIFWPVGLFFLFRKLMSETPGQRSRGTGRHPYDLQQQRAQQEPEGQAQQEPERQAQQQPKAVSQKRKRQSQEPAAAKAGPGFNLNRGRGTAILGTFLSVFFGLSAIQGAFSALTHGTDLISLLTQISMPLGLTCVGLIFLYWGIVRTRQTKRWRRYLTLIGSRDSISVAALAKAFPSTPRKVWDDLQDMLENGVLPRGFLDDACGVLVLTEDGLPTVESAPEAAPPPSGMEWEDTLLAEIKDVNDAIVNPELSQKIDRVGEITGNIFAYLRHNPGKETQLRGFFGYYLPTTLKILRTYAQMEGQGIEGENISSAKERIERMMDMVVAGFEKQLDLLFQNSAMDITSDVAVLEQMLRRDGLSQGDGLQLGG